MTEREWLNGLSDEDFTQEFYGVLNLNNEALKLKKDDFLGWLKSQHIKPCPCCGGLTEICYPDGGVGKIHTIEQEKSCYGFIRCEKCGLHTDQKLIGEAIKLWNTRVGDEK